MKKIVIILGVGAVLLVVALVAGLTIFLDSIVKKGVVTVTPMLTKTEVKLDQVSLSILSGQGTIRGFVMGNPQGFQSAQAIRIGRAHLSLQPMSVMSDKIVIRSIQIEAPEITYEGVLKNSNLNKILENVEAVTGSASTNQPAGTTPPAPSSTGQTKLQVDELLLTGAKVSYAPPGMGGKTVSLTIPDLKLEKLGQGPEGITGGELLKLVLSRVSQSTAEAVSKSLSDLSKQATTAVEDLKKQSAEDPAKAIKSVTDLLKKKEGEK